MESSVEIATLILLGIREIIDLLFHFYVLYSTSIVLALS